MKSIMVLKDGTAITIEDGASLNAIPIVSETKEDMIKVWDSLTPANLKEFEIQNSEGGTIGRYENCVLVSETSIVNADGTIRTSFQLHQKTEMELRVEALEETQADQDAAIEDLGTMTSTLADAVVGGE